MQQELVGMVVIVVKRGSLIKSQSRKSLDPALGEECGLISRGWRKLAAQVGAKASL